MKKILNRYNKLIITLPIFLLLFIPNTLSAQDTASFKTTFWTTCANDSTIFTNTSTTNCGSPTNFLWDFGDGNTSTLENPKHFYAIADTYNVQLIVNWACAPADTIIDSLIIITGAPPVLNTLFPFLSEDTLCEATTVLAFGFAPTADSLYIDWGDGASFKANTTFFFNIPHDYNISGNYFVTLQALNQCGRDTILDTIVIHTPPIAKFSLDTTNAICLGGTLILNDSSTMGESPIIKWNWEFGDFTTDTIQNPPLHNYMEDGPYIISLTITDSNGCSNISTDTIRFTENINLSDFFITESCPCSNLIFSTNNFSTNLIWDFGDGSTGIGNNISHTFNIPETHYIQLTGNDSLGCPFKSNKEIDVCPNETIYHPSKSNNNWFFPIKAGVSFSSGAPIVDTFGNAMAPFPEGPATISDPISGNLLFYKLTDTIWDATHKVMQNGSGIIGESSSQGALIVPYPGNKDKYYIFSQNGHTGFFIPPGLENSVFYSIVDMSLNGGLGGVEIATKNTLLTTTDGTEAISAVLKKRNTCNIGVAYWLIIATHNKDTISVFSIDEATGITLDHIETFPIGTFNTFNAFGSAFSNSALKYVLVGNSCLIFDFDPFTGTLSNLKQFAAPIPSFITNYYSVAFSPNESLLYINEQAQGIIQFDLSYPNIKSSEQLLLSKVGRRAMWYGDDGKLYFPNDNYLGVINNPNIYGTGSNLNDNDVFLGSHIAINGLQNIVNLSLPLLDTLDNPFSVDTTNCLTVAFTNNAITDTCSFTFANSIYHWDFGDGDTSNKHNPTHVYSSGGIYIVQLIIERPFMCTFDTITQSINVPFPNTATITCTTDTICLGDSINLNGSGGLFYNWNTGEITSSISVNPLVTDIFSLIASNPVTGCADTTYKTIIVEPLPIISISKDTTICLDDSLQLFASGGHAYLWNPNVDINDANNPNPMVYPKSTITYTLLVSDTFTDCKNIDSTTITIDASIPNAFARAEDTSICLGDNVQLTASGGNFYDWQPTLTLNNPMIMNPIATPDISTTYTVIVSNTCNKRDSTTININVHNCQLFIPNAFSPNGDGENDVFFLRGEGIENFVMKIYDRWGLVVFETTDFNKGWDGTINNKEINQGTYVYLINGTFNNGSPINQKGNLTLIR